MIKIINDPKTKNDDAMDLLCCMAISGFNKIASSADATKFINQLITAGLEQPT